ncbi:MAG: DNA protection during starvation protein [Planctomycetes bacterium]|nr:DNA protection during starvation protein [Planctomycetota bacterium]
MHDTRNSLALKTRTKVIDVLAARLADAADLATHAKQAHWNVRGPVFQQLHELFDSVNAHALAWTDELAERIAQLGGSPRGTSAATAKASSLPAFPLDQSDAAKLLGALSASLAAFANAARAGIDATDALGDAVTADLLTRLAGEADKDLWFLEAHGG